MRSLSPTSTASTVDVGFISPSFHHLDHSHHPDLFLSVDIHPHGGPPLFRGMWARSTLLGEGIVEGGTLGGPRKWEAQKVSRIETRLSSCLILAVFFCITPPPLTSIDPLDLQHIHASSLQCDKPTASVAHPTTTRPTEGAQ